MSTMREQIINEVGPTNTRLADRAKILALGQDAVPVLIDVFLNPATPYGDINQATVADALIEFSKQGNKEADAFIRKIALGEVRLTAGWGGAAREIVQQHFAWIGVDLAANASSPVEAAKSDQDESSTSDALAYGDQLLALNSQLDQARKTIETATSALEIRAALKIAVDTLDLASFEDDAERLRALECESSDQMIIQVRGQITTILALLEGRINDKWCRWQKGQRSG